MAGATTHGILYAAFGIVDDKGDIIKDAKKGVDDETVVFLTVGGSDQIQSVADASQRGRIVLRLSGGRNGGGSVRGASVPVFLGRR